MRHPLCWLTCKNRDVCRNSTIEQNILGTTLSWGGTPVVMYEWVRGCKKWGGTTKTRGYIPKQFDCNLLNIKYNDKGWPLDPETGEKLKIYEG